MLYVIYEGKKIQVILVKYIYSFLDKSSCVFSRDRKQLFHLLKFTFSNECGLI